MTTKQQTINKPKKIIKKNKKEPKEEDYEEVLGDYNYGSYKRHTITITGAGGGSHWWEWVITLADDNITVEEVAINNKDGLSYCDGNYFCIRHTEEGGEYCKNFYNEEEMEEANEKLKEYLIKFEDYEDNDEIECYLWREFENYE